MAEDRECFAGIARICSDSMRWAEQIMAEMESAGLRKIMPTTCANWAGKAESRFPNQNMPIPDYQTVMLPLLKLAADGKEHHIRDAINALGNQFGLSEQERKELLPSGVDRVFNNRIGWARTYLKKAGLIDYPKQGYFKATERGLKLISQNVSRVDVAFLKQYPEFLEFYAAKKPATAPEGAAESESPEVSSVTPEEAVAAGYVK